MPEIKGTQTEQNLRSAVSGESQARNKYDFFASKAKKEGFVEIAKIFEEIANNEKAHAKIWFDILECMSTTDNNLKSAAEGEHYEHSVMYAQFADTARKEGLDNLAELFIKVGEIEAHHEKVFNQLRCELEKGQVFHRDEEQYWLCTNCGHIHFGKDAPQICPVCSHPKAYFKINSDYR